MFFGIGDVDLVDDLVEVGVLPAAEIHQHARRARRCSGPDKGAACHTARGCCRHGRRSSRRTGPSGSGCRNRAARLRLAATPWRLSISRQHRAHGRAGGAEADDVERERLAVRRLPHAAVLLEALGLAAARRPSSGLNSSVSYFASRSFTASKYGSSGLYGGIGSDETVSAPEIGDVDDLLAVDVVAERPAHVLVVERLDLVVDVKRDRPPIDIAPRRLLPGMRGDLRILPDHRREGRRLHASRRNPSWLVISACAVCCSSDDRQPDIALDLRHRRQLLLGRPPAVAALEHLLLQRGFRRPSTARS